MASLKHKHCERGKCLECERLKNENEKRLLKDQLNKTIHIRKMEAQKHETQKALADVYDLKKQRAIITEQQNQIMKSKISSTSHSSINSTLEANLAFETPLVTNINAIASENPSHSASSESNLFNDSDKQKNICSNCHQSINEHEYGSWLLRRNSEQLQKPESINDGHQSRKHIKPPPPRRALSVFPLFPLKNEPSLSTATVKYDHQGIPKIYHREPMPNVSTILLYSEEKKSEVNLKNAQTEYLEQLEERRKIEKERIEYQKKLLKDEKNKANELDKMLIQLNTTGLTKSQIMLSPNVATISNLNATMINEDIRKDVSNVEENYNQTKNYSLETKDTIISSMGSNIGVIGLPKTGRSTLIGALAGGLWPKQLSTTNPIKTNFGNIYKLNYPNNGFVDGSVKENEPIYKEFFENSHLKNLASLLITVDGNVREEDYLVISIAQKNNIPVAVVRTKLDEWLCNLPKNQTKAKYVEEDKTFVLKILHNLGVTFDRDHIFNVSALASIVIAEDGHMSDMLRYQNQEDEKKLQQFLKRS